MKIKRSYKNAGISAVCICLSLALILNTIQPMQKVEARGTPESGPRISVVFSSKMSEDRTSSDVTITASPAQADVAVVGIYLPDGQYIEGDKAVYTAVRNGWQDFTVLYDQEEKVTEEGGDGSGNNSGGGGNNGGGSAGDDNIASPSDAVQESTEPEESESSDADQSETSESSESKVFALSQLLPKAYALTADNQNTNSNQEEKPDQSSETESNQGTAEDSSSGAGSGNEAEKPTESDTAEKPSESSAETEAQKPSDAETEAPKPTESGAETEAQKPTESDKETEAQKPTESGAETEAQKPTESDKETEAQKPGEGAAKPSEPDAENGTGETKPSVDADADTPVTPNIRPEDPNQRPITVTETEDSDSSGPEVEIVRKSQTFRYEVTGIGEVAQPFEQRAAFPEDGMEVLVKADIGVFPEGATAKITRIIDADQTSGLQADMQKGLSETEVIFQAVFYDIVILDKDGNEIQPDKTKGEVKVVFNRLKMPRAVSEEEDAIESLTVLNEPEELDTSRKIFVFDEENKGEFLETVETETGIEAKAPHFSVYGVATTRGFTNMGTITSGDNGRTKDLANNTIYTVTPNSGQTEVVLDYGKTSINVHSGRTSVIYIPKGIRLKVTARDPGTPAIWLPPGATLIVVGEGNLIATGGNAGNAASGQNGGSASPSGNYYQTGNGGAGGSGGKGAGAGIGGAGGSGGAGGAGGTGGEMWPPTYHHGPGGAQRFGGFYHKTENNSARRNGGNGADGESMGNLYVLDKARVEGYTGAPGSAGGSGNGGTNQRGQEQMSDGTRSTAVRYGVTGGAGGGGGGGGSHASGIGGGGAGGGGGGGGRQGASGANLYELVTMDQMRVDPVFWGGSGGGGGGGQNPGTGGKATRITESGHDVVVMNGRDGGNGTTTNGGGGHNDGSPSVRVMIFYTQQVATESHSLGSAGSGGKAGNRGGNGRVYKSVNSTVLNAGATPQIEDSHNALKYNLSVKAEPAGAGNPTGAGSHMYGKTVNLNANPARYYALDRWVPGPGADTQTGDMTSPVLPVVMNKFGDIAFTARYRKQVLTFRELSGGSPVNHLNYIARILPAPRDLSAQFQVLGDGVPIAGDKSEVSMRHTTSNGDYSGAVDWSGNTLSLSMMAGRRPVGTYDIRVNGAHLAWLNLIQYALWAPAPGENIEIMLESETNGLASDSVKVEIEKGNSGRKVTVDGVDVADGQEPIQIVPKSEVLANKDTWGGDDAISKIALEINGQPYRSGIELNNGENLIEVFNANNLKSTPNRQLRLRLPNQSDGQPVYVEIELRVMPSPMKTLTLQPEIQQAANNPITGQPQPMATPTLEGANGTPQPALTQYNLVAGAPGTGYHFTGWFEKGTDTPVTTAAAFTYTIPADKQNVTLIAKYEPYYHLQPGSIKGDYLVSGNQSSFSHTYRVARVQGQDSMTGDHSTIRREHLKFVRKNGQAEQAVDDSNYTLTSWMGKDIEVAFNNLSAGIYYPKMLGITQGQPHPTGADKQWLTLSKLDFGIPTGETAAKDRLTMKASSVLDQEAKDSVNMELKTPYDDVTSLKLLRVEAGTATNPLTLVGQQVIKDNKLTWGWADTQSKISLSVNDQEVLPTDGTGTVNINLNVTGANEFKIANANAIKDAFTTEMIFTIEMTRRGGEKLQTKVTVPIDVEPTQIRVSVPMSVTMVIAPDGKLISPNLAIKNSTPIPITIEAVKVKRSDNSTIQFVPAKPDNGAMDKLYGVVNVQNGSGTEQIVLASMTEDTNKTVDWKLQPGTVDTPTSLPIDFKGSYISLMSGGWPTSEAEIFKLSYTVQAMKQ